MTKRLWLVQLFESGTTNISQWISLFSFSLREIAGKEAQRKLRNLEKPSVIRIPYLAFLQLQFMLDEKKIIIHNSLDLPLRKKELRIRDSNILILSIIPILKWPTYKCTHFVIVSTCWSYFHTWARESKFNPSFT